MSTPAVPNVTIATPWRQRAGEIPAYRARVEALDWPADRLRFVMEEGDSTDNTYAGLRAWAQEDPRVTTVKLDTGQPLYGSVVDPGRFWTLAVSFNAALEAVDYDWSDYVLFAPCDVRYGPDLLRRLQAWRVDVVAPFVFQRGRFYDIWAFSRQGRPMPAVKEEETIARFGEIPILMDTVGGLVLIDCDVLRAGVRYSPVDVDRGFSEAARAAGFLVWADPGLHVYHGDQ